MSTIEIKNKLHYLIDTINDSERLKAVLTLLNANDENTDWYDGLSNNNKKDIEAGLVDLEKGNVHSDEDVRASVRKRILAAKK